MTFTNEQIGKIISQNVNDAFSDEAVENTKQLIVEMANKVVSEHGEQEVFNVIYTVAFNLSKASAKHAVYATINTLRDLDLIK